MSLLSNDLWTVKSTGSIPVSIQYFWFLSSSVIGLFFKTKTKVKTMKWVFCITAVAALLWQICIFDMSKTEWNGMKQEWSWLRMFESHKWKIVKKFRIIRMNEFLLQMFEVKGVRWAMCDDHRASTDFTCSLSLTIAFSPSWPSVIK